MKKMKLMFTTIGFIFFSSGNYMMLYNLKSN